ncbi:uncharacterized methyltransferase YdaC [Aplysia californica]|uniref:Uncharacterized methyltransferase YdaC n=1 Tax=Aplysia californica TaxID=6500 RepID=A0ABM0JL70_APLCA|nr:uncharacterized methyltransferase YdaC [Aplysia californica]
MAQRLKLWFADQVARNLRLPQKGPVGWFTVRAMVKKNSFLEKNAVILCDMKPDHNVLEIGFGPGVGLESAYNVVKGGSGKVYGIDTSFFMVDTAKRRLTQAVKDKKVMLFHGSATHIPLNTDSVHRVFHCNCYYFWPNMRSVMREIYRVMRPGSVMVTTLNLNSLQMTQKKGFLQYGRPDPVKYMTCLENFGFENVHLEYRKDPGTGDPFQVIFAEIKEKPAHDKAMLSDDEDDELEREEMLKDDKVCLKNLTDKQMVS